jgi:hypothetical protein
VQPVEISPDDRLISIYLGENANTFINVCLSTGKLVSTVAFDKRMTIKPMFSASGKVLAFQATPNSDDPLFNRPSADFGLLFYNSYSGKQISSLALPRADVENHKKHGAKYFMDGWQGWLGFSSEDATVFRYDTQQSQARLLKEIDLKLRGPHLGQEKCTPVRSQSSQTDSGEKSSS